MAKVASDRWHGPAGDGGNGTDAAGNIAVHLPKGVSTSLVQPLPTPVREEGVSAPMPCGPDIERHVAGIREFDAAGFTHVALVQIGGDTQERFITWAGTELLPLFARHDPALRLPFAGVPEVQQFPDRVVLVGLGQLTPRYREISMSPVNRRSAPSKWASLAAMRLTPLMVSPSGSPAGRGCG